MNEVHVAISYSSDLRHLYVSGVDGQFSRKNSVICLSINITTGVADIEDYSLWRARFNILWTEQYDLNEMTDIF